MKLNFRRRVIVRCERRKDGLSFSVTGKRFGVGVVTAKGHFIASFNVFKPKVDDIRFYVFELPKRGRYFRIDSPAKYGLTMRQHRR